MIRPGFLDSESRRDLIELARDGSAAHRLARRANALVLLDKGMSCQSIAEVLLLDGDTIRTCYQIFVSGPDSCRHGQSGRTLASVSIRHQPIRRFLFRPVAGLPRYSRADPEHDGLRCRAADLRTAADSGGHGGL
jgi:hypothetical protein